MCISLFEVREILEQFWSCAVSITTQDLSSIKGMDLVDNYGGGAVIKRLKSVTSAKIY